MSEQISLLTLPDRKLAYQQVLENRSQISKKPLLFLGGYASDMTGSKASFLADRCKAEGRGLLRFDYRGHGQSSGTFTEGTIGAWFQDALAVFDQLTQGPQVLIGSSMGGWIALLLARARPERVAGFVGIAAAPDFTEELIVPSLTPAQKEQLTREGLTYEEDAPPDRRVPITQSLIDEAREHLVMQRPLTLNAPVHLLQGQQDADVPWQFALKVADHVTGPDLRLTLIKDANHSLSRPQDLDLLWRVVDSMG